jgi:HK97 family phage portal protein
MTASRALNFAPVWQAVSLISGDVAKLPLNVYARNLSLGERGRELAGDHPAARVIRWQANPQMSAHKFWRRMMIHALLWNNSYALIDRNPVTGDVLGLYPLLPDRTRPEMQDDGTLLYVSDVGGVLRGYSASQVLHIENVAITGEADCELVVKARNSFALGLAAEKFASKFFRNGARIGGILEVPAGMTKTAADNLEQGFRKTYEDDNPWRSIVLRDGSKFHQAQFTPEQGQMIGARMEQVRDVARWYNLPPHKLGDDARTSYASLEQENRSYLDSCLSNWLAIIAAECWLKLLQPIEQEQNSHYIEHNIAALVAADIKTQYEIANIAINAGLLSPNEFRATQNLNPRTDGLGDKFIMPLNMQFTDTPTAEPEPEPEPEPVENLEVEEVEEDNSAVIDSGRALLVDAATRAAAYLSREMKRNAKQKTASRFCSWLLDKYATVVRGTVEEELRAACDLAADLSGEPRQQVLALVAAVVIDGLHDEINEQLGRCTEPEMLAEVTTTCDDFPTAAGIGAGAVFDSLFEVQHNEAIPK